MIISCYKILNMANKHTGIDKIAARVAKTIDYMNSAKGNAAWFANERHGYNVRMNYMAAIQTATRLRRYEEMAAVFDAIGPALNARAARSTA
jgi:hypothetical protein